MKVSIKNCLGLVTLFMASVACADVHSDVKALQGKVDRTLEVIKQKMDTAMQDSKTYASRKDKAAGLWQGFHEGEQILKELSADLRATLADVRYSDTEQLKLSIKSDIIDWLTQKISWLDNAIENGKKMIASGSDEVFKKYAEGVNEGTILVVGYLKPFLAELKNIVQ